MTPHFTDDELRCKCGCGMLPKPDFMERIEKLRIQFGKPMKVNRAASCPAHNDKIYQDRGAPAGEHLEGPHTTGRAIDLDVNRGDAYKLLKLALIAGFTGIGIKQHGKVRYMHIDDLEQDEGQPRPTIWSYP